MSTTTFKKKQLKWAIPSVLLGILLLAIPFFVRAIPIFEAEIVFLPPPHDDKQILRFSFPPYEPLSSNGIIRAAIHGLSSLEPACQGIEAFPYHFGELPNDIYMPLYAMSITENCPLNTAFYFIALDDEANFLNPLWYIPIYRGASNSEWELGSGMPICELGNCKVCEHYDSCIGAGCFWEYSLIYLQIDPKMTGYYCREPYEPDPEQCGAVYKCQYCTAQETCEAEILCEWTDRGFGDRCYMSEAIIPPPQIGWEVPELEDCEELSGTEKLLCEIKNFITGIFMPSQEKVNALVNTFGAFKQRFPFNYIGALSNFFSDIKISLNTEKSIPVKILGQEGEVSFTLFDKTAIIGGQVETFKNVWIDFTTLIIFIVFLVWLLNFIMRFFP